MKNPLVSTIVNTVALLFMLVMAFCNTRDVVAGLAVTLTVYGLAFIAIVSLYIASTVRPNTIARSLLVVNWLLSAVASAFVFNAQGFMAVFFTIYSVVFGIAFILLGKFDEPTHEHEYVELTTNMESSYSAR